MSAVIQCQCYKHLQKMVCHRSVFFFIPRTRRIEDEIQSISQMKWLEYLEIKYLTDDGLVRILDNCTNLKEIDVIRGFHDNSLTPQGIRDALKCADRLEKITFDILYNDTDIIFNQRIMFDEIAQLRRDRSINVQMKIVVFVYERYVNKSHEKHNVGHKVIQKCSFFNLLMFSFLFYPHFSQILKSIFEPHSDWIKRIEVPTKLRRKYF